MPPPDLQAPPPGGSQMSRSRPTRRCAGTGANRLRIALVLVVAQAALCASAVPASAATFVGSWGSLGSDHGQFSGPAGVAVDANGHVYVADTGNHRIEKFDADGGFVRAWGSYGSGNGQFRYPGGVAVDAHGHVYVADTWHHRIEKFDANGEFLLAWGSSGSGKHQFSFPEGVAVDGNG